MRVNCLFSVRSAAIAACLLAGLLFTTPVLHADEVGLDVNEPSWVAKTLNTRWANA